MAPSKFRNINNQTSQSNCFSPVFRACPLFLAHAKNQTYAATPCSTKRGWASKQARKHASPSSPANTSRLTICFPEHSKAHHFTPSQRQNPNPSKSKSKQARKETSEKSPDPPRDAIPSAYGSTPRCRILPTYPPPQRSRRQRSGWWSGWGRTVVL